MAKITLKINSNSNQFYVKTPIVSWYDEFNPSLYQRPTNHLELYYTGYKNNKWQTPILIDTLENLSSVLNDTTKDRIIDLSNENYDYINLAFKYRTEDLNNSGYSNNFNVVMCSYSSSTKTTKDLHFFENRTDEHSNLNGFFSIVVNTTNNTMSKFTNAYYINSIENITLLPDTVPNGYNGENTDPEEPIEPEEPETPTDPTYKDITLTLDKTSFSSAIHSNIELYYSTDDVELFRLGTSKENNSFTINFDTSKQVFLYFKYVNENVDVSKCIDCFQLDSLDTYSIYNEEKQLFYLGSITENATLKEIKCVCPMIESIKLTNATCETTEIDYTHDTTIEVKANTNHYFNLEPYLKYMRPGYSYQTDTFTLNEDRTIATITIKAKETLSNFYHSELVAIAEIKTIISQDYGLITIYKPDNEILNQLPSKTLFEKSYSADSGGVHIQTIDLSKNILGCLSIPLDVESVGSKEITLQGIPTNLFSEYINDNIYKIDFGNVEIKGIYNNSVDYKNTKLFIYLPFISLQSLDVNKYMNKIVNLSYTVDIFSGDFLAELKINNIIVDTFSGNLAIKVPYITNGEKTQSISNYSVLDKNNLLSDRIPKIIIETNDINIDTVHNTLQHININELQGYNSIDNLQLNTDSFILQDDIEQIKNILKSGVIF